MSNAWVLQDAAPVSDGVVGGDGAGESLSVRWIHTNGHAAITVRWYAVDMEVRRGEPVEDGYRYDIERCVEWAMFESADDIGGTETWADGRYDYPNDLALATEAEAEALVRYGAERDRRAFINRVSWDGESIPNI